MIVLCTRCRTPHELKGKQYLCKPCKKKHQRVIHQRNRIAWYALVGCECIKCGYSKSHAALDFHHRDPADKLFSIGTKFNAHNPETCKPDVRAAILLEVKKCDLLCSNCHREHHYKQTKINMEGY